MLTGLKLHSNFAGGNEFVAAVGFVPPVAKTSADTWMTKFYPSVVDDIRYPRKSIKRHHSLTLICIWYLKS